MSEAFSEETADDGSPVGQVLEALHDANDAINGAAESVGLTEKVDKSPYVMVAAALGVGYVLGGGLFTTTTFRLLKLGMKVAQIPAVRDRLLGVAETAVDGVLSQTNPEEQS